MYMIVTSFCVFFSLIVSSGYCDKSDADNVLKKIYVTWSSENDQHFFTEEPARNLRDLLPSNVSSWGPFSADVLCAAGQLLLKKDSITDINNLTTIHTSGCRKLDIEPGALRNLPQLKALIFSFNNLTEIKSGTFDNLTISQLELNYNKIDTLQPGAFQHLPNLTKLNLGTNKLKILHNGEFSGVSTIEELILSFNRISQIEREAFKNLPHLKDLHLKFNKLTKLNCRAFNFKKLEKLNLIDNGLLSLPSGCFKNMRKLREVYLSTNNLTEIPEGLFNFSKFKRIDLKENRISVIASNAFKIPTLRILELDNNKLKIWDSQWMQSTPNLRILSAGENQVEKLPDGAFSYGSFINFANNRIKSISKGAFRNRGEIKLLQLENNEIDTWNVNLPNNVTIRHVDLRNNKFQCVDGDLEEVFKGVLHAQLDGNPWRSDCQSKTDMFYVGMKLPRASPPTSNKNVY